jgi:hypothetical protein
MSDENIKQAYAYSHDLHYAEPPEVLAIREEYKKTGICKHNWVNDNQNKNNSQHGWHCTICGQNDIYMGGD